MSTTISLPTAKVPCFCCKGRINSSRLETLHNRRVCSKKCKENVDNELRNDPLEVKVNYLSTEQLTDDEFNELIDSVWDEEYSFA